MKVLLLFFVSVIVVLPLKILGATYTWNGNNSTEWNDSGNWSPPFLGTVRVPNSGDDVIVGPGLFAPARYPVIKFGDSPTCNSVTFQNLTGASLTVNGSLTTNAITLAHNSSIAAGDVDALITGSGTINCTALNVGDGKAPNALQLTTKNTSTLKVNIRQLISSGAITVASTTGNSKTNNSVFIIQNDNGACNVSATALNVNTPSPLSNTIASAKLSNISTGAMKLKLTANPPFSISNSTYGSMDLYTTGSGTCTVEYGGSSAQTVITTLSGLDTSPTTYQSIAFSGAGVKTINTALNIPGDWTSSGGLVDCGANIITFQGAAATTETLTDLGSNSNKGVVFKNVVFNGGGDKVIASSTNPSFSVSGTGLLTMAANTKLTVGSNGLTLVSDATGTATVAPIPTGCSIVGPVNVQRYFKAGTIAGNTRNYRLLSSPVNANSITNDSGSDAYSTLSYLNSNPGVFIAGPGGPTNGFTVTNATPTMYLYKENLPASNASFNSGNFKGIAKITGSPLTIYNDAGTAADKTATLYAGNGYMLYYAGNNTTNVTSTTVLNKQFRVGGAYIDPDAATATAIGTLNQGIIPVKLWVNQSTALLNAQTGFNLVGNPYASTIDWDTFSSSTSTAPIYGPGVSSTIYVFNYNNKNYGAYQAGSGSTGTNNASRYIASGQGFFVIAGASASLTFTEAAKTTTQPTVSGGTYLLMGLPAQAAQTQQILRIKLIRDSVNTDESLLLFEPGAQNAYEDGKDAKRLNGIGNVVTLATYATGDTQQLAIDHLHSIDSTTRVKMYVNVSGAPGTDTLSMSGFNTLDPRYDVYLTDHYKKDSVLIGNTGKYAFDINISDATSFGADRFELAFHKKAGLDYHLLSFTGAITRPDITLTWKVTNEKDLTGFTIEKLNSLGKFVTVFTRQSDGSGIYSWIDKAATSGKNIYRLKQDDPFDRISYSTLVSVNMDPLALPDPVLVAYPNPAPTQFSIKFNNATPPAQVMVRIFSPTGQMLTSKVADGNNIQQDISRLMPGTYIVEVSNNDTKKAIGRVKISKP